MISVAWVLPSLAPVSNSRYCAELLLGPLSRSFAIQPFCASAGSIAGMAVAPLSALKSDSFSLTFLHFEAIAGDAALRPLLQNRGSVVWFHDLHDERGTALAAADIATVRCALFSSYRNLLEFKRGIGATWEGEVWQLPYPVVLPASDPAGGRALDERTVAFAGAPWSESRVEKLFAALTQLHQPRPLIWLIDQSEEQGARRILEQFPAQQVELQFNRSPERWVEILAQAGVAVHLRVSAIGDPGPYLPLSWAHGVPTVVSEFAEGDYVLPSISARVRPGVDETAALCDILQQMEAATARRATALDYVREFHHHLSLSAELERLFLRILR